MEEIDEFCTIGVFWKIIRGLLDYQMENSEVLVRF